MLICSVVNFPFDTNNYISKILFLSLKFLLLKNTFKVTLQNFFNVFIIFNTVSYVELNLKLKVDPKMYTFKNLKEIWKIWKNNLKNKWQPKYNKIQ